MERTAFLRTYGRLIGDAPIRWSVAKPRSDARQEPTLSVEAWNISMGAESSLAAFGAQERKRMLISMQIARVEAHRAPRLSSRRAYIGNSPCRASPRSDYGHRHRGLF
jgi:hypothetical protein